MCLQQLFAMRLLVHDDCQRINQGMSKKSTREHAQCRRTPFHAMSLQVRCPLVGD